jgi:hypothetical protein
MVQLHLNPSWSDDEADKVDSLHVELALRQFQVEPCLLKLREDALDVLRMLLERV